MKILHVFTLSLTPIAFFDGQFRFLKEHGYDVVFACERGDGIEAFAERNGVKFIPIEISRSMSPVVVVKAIMVVRNIIEVEQPVAVFGHTPVGAFVSMVASKLLGVKNRIYYRHGILYSTMTGLKQKVFMAEEKFVSALATKIVNVSPSLARKCVMEGINKPEKQIVIGNGTCGGIDARELFNPALLDAGHLELERERLGLNDADIVFGFCGRLCRDKGTPEMLDAFDLFRKKHKDLNVKMLLTGTLDERESLPEDTRRIILDDADVVMTGWINKFDIPYYFGLLDCFVFPSHREGFGMSVIEASAMEVPILVAPSHGCIDSIQEGVSGFYIDLNAESICEGMERMLEKDSMRTIGRLGRKFILETFDYRIMWPKILEMYNQILR